MKENTTMVEIDEKLLETAIGLGIDVRQVVSAAIEAAVREASISDTVKLNELPSIINALNGMPVGSAMPSSVSNSSSGVSYQKLYRAAVDQTIPTIRSETGRWYVKRSDIPNIAKKMSVIEDFDL